MVGVENPFPNTSQARSKMKMQSWAGIAAAVSLSLAAAAAAADTESLGSFDDWQAYRYGAGDGRICYMASLPTTSKGGPDNRDDAYVTVTHRPAENSTDVVSVVGGYGFKKGSEAVFNVDGREFQMFTQGDGAWLKTAAEDKQAVQAMIRGLKLVVRGEPDTGGASVDSYSLKGFTAAHAAISKACGVD